jgi:hypothetical protein
LITLGKKTNKHNKKSADAGRKMTNPIKDTLVRLEEMLHLQSFTSLADSESKDVTLTIETNMTMTTSMMILILILMMMMMKKEEK